MLKRILVGLAGSDSTRATVNPAVALAIAHHAELPGVSVMDPARAAPFMAMPIGDGPIDYAETASVLAEARERVERATREFTEACKAVGVRHRVIREVGGPFSLMTDEARYHGLETKAECITGSPKEQLWPCLQKGGQILLSLEAADDTFCQDACLAKLHCTSYGTPTSLCSFPNDHIEERLTTAPLLPEHEGHREDD